MSSGPGYTVNDLAYYGGLMLGLSGTYTVLMNWDAYHELLDKLDLLPFARLVTLVLSFMVGAVLGAIALAALRRYQEAQKAATERRAETREDYRKDYHEDRGEHDPHR